MTATNIGFQRIQSTKARRGQVRPEADFQTPAYALQDEDASYAFVRKDARRQRMETSRQKMLVSLSR